MLFIILTVWGNNAVQKYYRINGGTDQVYTGNISITAYNTAVTAYYYDSKGSDNEKMQAYYLMGCVYRDQKEAPRAMMSYKKAVEYADTLSKKCDYCTLSKVYGQMAEIYSRQYLHSKAVENFHKYSDYSFLSNNHNL